MKNSATILLLLLVLSACSQQKLPFGTGSSAALNSTGPGTSAGPAVNLNWTAIPGEQQGFKIESSIDGKNFSLLKTVPDGTTSVSLTGLSSGTIYFRIYGYNQAGNSPDSVVVQASVP